MTIEITKEVVEETPKSNITDEGTYFEKIVDNTTTIKLYKPIRASARKRGAARIEVIAIDGDESFVDTMTVKSSISVAAYKMMENIDGVMGDQEINFSDMILIMEQFPSFLTKIVLTASFNKSIEEFESFDDMIKISLFELLFELYGTIQGEVSKK